MIFIFHKMFVSVEYWYPLQDKVGSEFFNLSKRVCALYDTFKRFDISTAQPALSDFAAKAAEFNKTHLQTYDSVSSEEMTEEKDGETA